jgi:undecaprenyl diphosphate synthase
MKAPEMLARIRENGAIPRHIAIIMDGNGRWARERNLPRPLGHRSGMKSVREVVEGAIEAGVEVLSLFAFSQENWQRPVTEIQALMSLLEEYIAREAEELARQGVRVQVLGDLARLTPAAGSAAAKLIETTAHNDKLLLNLFISYGSRARSCARRSCSRRRFARGDCAPKTSMRMRSPSGCTRWACPIRIC